MLSSWSSSSPSTLQVITDSECQQRFYFSGITSNMLCAEDASGNGGSNPCLVNIWSWMMMKLMVSLMIILMLKRSICQADSGGPLVTCGDSANCGTTTGNNYDLIGGLSSPWLCSSCSSNMSSNNLIFKAIFLKEFKTGENPNSQVLCHMDLIAALTYQQSTRGCCWPNNDYDKL